MLKKSNFKARRKNFYIFLTLSFLAIVLIISSLDLRRIFESEIQEIQSFAPSFSSVSQLYDEGDITNGIPLGTSASNLLKSLIDRILGKENSNIKEIKIFIKFKNFEKILKDRETALLNSINADPKNVPCKVSDGIKIYKCKVRLKGDLADHWSSVKRMSLRIDVKGGFIHGMKEFSIQQPRTRQFPYDAVFHDINKEFGRLSGNTSKFYSIKVNGESWGVMNAEPIIDEKYIEINEVKRAGIFRISNQKAWAHSRINDSYPYYFISDPTINISMRGNDKVVLESSILNEIYSHIFFSLSNKDGSVFDRQTMLGNLAYALVWGSLHTLSNANAWYVWNTYEKKLEPVLTDQASWQNTKIYIDSLRDLPFEYKIMFKNNPLKKDELYEELIKLDDFFKKNNPIDNVNNLKKKYFPNDQKFTKTPIYENLSYLNENISDVVTKINLLASLDFENTKMSKITSEQLEQIDKVSEIFHFSDGTVRIFNLLANEIEVKNIIIGDIKSNIDRTIPPSKPESLSFIDIKTNLLGYHSDAISVKFIINGKEKIDSNTYSLTKINYDLDSPKTAENYCQYNKSENHCILKGVVNIDESIVINNKTIINPGTRINFQEGGNLIFNSSVLINGTTKDPVSFDGNGFGGVYIKNGNEQISIIKNTNFNNLATVDSLLKRYTGSINGYGGTFKLMNVTISNGNAEDQLNIINAKVDISGLNISNATSDAFDCDFCKGTIKDINFLDVGGDGLDISGSNLNITKMYARNIKDKAFSVGENSLAYIDNAFYDSVATGIAVKDSSVVEASNISLKNVDYDLFMTYVKKPFYKGDTKLEVKEYSVNGEFESNVCVREKGTYLVVNNTNCEISEINIDELYQGRMKK
tara:strand:- start:203 stop:2809 length:2607 start_codon:yes stop_codon:yes gene_type:complete